MVVGLAVPILILCLYTLQSPLLEHIVTLLLHLLVSHHDLISLDLLQSLFRNEILYGDLAGYSLPLALGHLLFER